MKRENKYWSKDYNAEYNTETKFFSIIMNDVDRDEFNLIRMALQYFINSPLTPKYSLKNNVMKMEIKYCPEKIANNIFKLLEAGETKKIFG